jgi:hypothetical protein
VLGFEYSMLKSYRFNDILSLKKELVSRIFSLNNIKSIDCFHRRITMLTLSFRSWSTTRDSLRKKP